VCIIFEMGEPFMLQEFKEAFDAVSKLAPEQRSPYQTWLVVELIRDVAYYIVLGLIVWTLGRRLINATLVAMRESKRERA
jgi:hypothetical protein